MIWVRDITGRFAERPHYEPEELDNDCEAIVEDVLLRRHGEVVYPVLTDDLFFMLEQTACVDPYAEFDPAEGEIWGESEFRPGEQPRVFIRHELSENPRYENPLRTTLTHEFSHVHYHGPLFELERSRGESFEDGRNKTWVCKRDHVEGHRKRDWTEWQASYCSGALLIPKRALREAVKEFLGSHELIPGQVMRDTLDEIELVSEVVRRFAVSREAAAVRLRQQRHVVEGMPSGEAFRA
ncbi:MAG: ImmA/IrrE family metallo-endopeptidase [Acidobacteria bacterium]|nr:MAG: ImmA/IrrE family metallo-endopeptidase [Acidobacteriota bacterium]